MALLKKYHKKVNPRVRRELMARFAISEREFMNGKDINHVYKLLNTLDERRKQLDIQKLSLINKKD